VQDQPKQGEKKRGGGTEGGRKGKRWEGKAKRSLEISLNADIQRGAEIFTIPLSLETSNLTLINHGDNQGISLSFTLDVTLPEP
jgi:hypothetical protein